MTLSGLLRIKKQLSKNRVTIKATTLGRQNNFQYISKTVKPQLANSHNYITISGFTIHS